MTALYSTSMTALYSTSSSMSSASSSSSISNRNSPYTTNKQENSSNKVVDLSKIDNALFINLPDELIFKIFSFCNPYQNKGNLSSTCRQFRLISQKQTTQVVLRVPYPDSSFKTMSDTVFGNIIQKLSRLQRLIIYEGIFCSLSSRFVQSLIGFLNKHYPKQLHTLELGEIRDQDWNLNRDLFHAFGHSQLRVLTISPLPSKSIIDTDIVNAILDRSPNLTSLTFNGELFSHTIDLLFSRCISLKQLTVNLPRGALDSKTIALLKTSTTIQELTIAIDADHRSVQQIENLFVNPHKLPLKKLNLSGIATTYFSCDAAFNLTTRQLPNLEHFSYDFTCTISDIGLLNLALNCPKLRMLEFDFQRITNEGLRDFAQKAPNLEKLKLMCYHSPITDAGISDLAQYCKNLRAVYLYGNSAISIKGLLALATHCPNLEFFCFDKYAKFGFDSYDKIEEFIISSPKLQYIELLDQKIRGMVEKQFPHIKTPFHNYYKKFDKV